MIIADLRLNSSRVAQPKQATELIVSGKKKTNTASRAFISSEVDPRLSMWVKDSVMTSGIKAGNIIKS